MAPKKNAREAAQAASATQSTTGSAPSTPAKVAAAKSAPANWDVVIQNIYNHYIKETSQRTKLIDAFLFFLVVVAALQFVYCILVGNYPFNAFLSGFSATLGQFVLTVSLRIQTDAKKSNEFPSVSPERAFADFVVCSLILHFFCVNFIN